MCFDAKEPTVCQHVYVYANRTPLQLSIDVPVTSQVRRGRIKREKGQGPGTVCVQYVGVEG